MPAEVELTMLNDDVLEHITVSKLNSVPLNGEKTIVDMHVKSRLPVVNVVNG